MKADTNKKRFKQTTELIDIIFDKLTVGIALCELLTDKKGNPTDYRFLKINTAFEKHTSLKYNVVINKTIGGKGCILINN